MDLRRSRTSQSGALTNALNESFGEAVRTIDRLFGGLNTSVKDPLSQWILAELNSTIHMLLNGSFGSLDEAFDACETMIKEQVTAPCEKLF